MNAKRRVEQVQKVLEKVGLESERVRMVNLSSAMGRQFAELAAEFSAEIEAIGPSPLAEHNHDPEDQELVA